MNKKPHVQLIIIFVLSLLALSGCVSIPYNTGGLVVGQSYRLESGETIDQDLTVVGGNVTLETGSTVNGDMAVIGGNVNINGRVDGDLTVMGGYVRLEDDAVIKGEVSTLGGQVDRSPGAVVEGGDRDRVYVPGPVRSFNGPSIFEPIAAMLMAIFQALALAALAIVITLVAPLPMNRTGQAALAQAPASGGVGCLTVLVLVVMAITIILIPVSLLGMLVAGVAILFGWAALGLILGRRMAVWLNQTWTDPVSAGIGTLTLSLLTSLVGAIPCIGWTVPFAVAMVALGAVVLTRFGTQLYPPAYTPAAPIPNAEVYPSQQQPRQEPPEERNPFADEQ